MVLPTLLSMVIGLPIVASDTCVKDARTALDAWFPRAFGAEAEVRGPMSTETVERESLERIARCSHCPQQPFGYQHPEWKQFKSLLRQGDCIVFFRSNPDSWRGLYGSEGYAIIRNGKILRTILTLMN